MSDNAATDKKNLQSVTIAGVYIKSDAYPNVKYKVEGLLRVAKLKAREINCPPAHLQRLGKSRFKVLGMLRTLGSAVYFAYVHMHTLLSLLFARPKGALYVPYPAVFILFLMSFLPDGSRPARVCADAFISLYDTVVEDRKLISRDNIIARLLFAIERRAYNYADLTLVDTALNAAYLCKIFALPASKVMALPLSINEKIYHYVPYQVKEKRCNVLFIGTFVPLQGVEVIAQAFTLLQKHSHIHLHLIGDGQTAAQVAAVFKSAACTNYTWEQRWQSPEALAQAIGEADICLGIFGSNEKTQRVWPLKNYAYMAMGRAIITADTQAARDMMGSSRLDAFETVPAADHKALARAIEVLANDPEQRMRLAESARLYYAQYLSNAASLEELVAQLQA